MYTQCPKCDAIFQLSASQLKAANGDVRCGQCLSVFNALDHLSEELPQSKAAEPSADLAADVDPYRDASSDDAAVLNTEDAPEIGVATLGSEEAEHPGDDTLATPPAVETDIFNAVIAEAGTHEIPEEEIDLFEAFLESEELVVASEEEVETTLDAADADADAADNDIDRDHITPASTTPSLATADDDATPLGDVEMATADLEMAALLGSDDEFAEFDSYLSEADNASTGEEAATAHASDQATEAQPAEESPAEVNPALENFTPETEAIIIEEADLVAVNSAAYSDTPRSTDAPLDENDVTRETPSAEPEHVVDTEPQPTTATDAADAEAPQAPVIPSLILEDLQAAKAEQLRPSTAPWMVGSLVLMLTLVLQVVYHSRDELAKDPSLRPWLIQMCQWAHCSLRQPYDIKQIEIIGRDVRTHPTARKALIASTSIINNAPFVQPFPLLTVVFSDINGKQLARRRFTPREYLNNNVDLAAGMTPDTPVRIELELVDPGKAAVNYEFLPELDPRATRPLS
jgi:predicted Zn finger-like uncharacterized protein